MQSTKILEKLKGDVIMNYYLAPFHNKGFLKQGQHISNPFLIREQKTPSFNIYRKNDKWYYKDFATDDQGDCFSLVMKLHDCSFKQAINIISVDFNL